MSLLTIQELRSVVSTGLDDTRLQEIIDREEELVIDRLGAHYDGVTAITEEWEGERPSVFVRRPILSITSITERLLLSDTGVTMTTSQYYAYKKQGRIVRLPQPQFWGRLVTVVYIAADDDAKRKQYIIELIRLALEQTAMQSESVAGEYSYQAPIWEEIRGRMYRKMSFLEI